MSDFILTMNIFCGAWVLPEEIKTERRLFFGNKKAIEKAVRSAYPEETKNKTIVFHIDYERTRLFFSSVGPLFISSEIWKDISYIKDGRFYWSTIHTERKTEKRYFYHGKKKIYL